MEKSFQNMNANDIVHLFNITIKNMYYVVLFRMK